MALEKAAASSPVGSGVPRAMLNISTLAINPTNEPHRRLKGPQTRILT